MQSANTGSFYWKSKLRHSGLIQPANLDIPLWRWKFEYQKMLSKAVELQKACLFLVLLE